MESLAHSTHQILSGQHALRTRQQPVTLSPQPHPRLLPASAHRATQRSAAVQSRNPLPCRAATTQAPADYTKTTIDLEHTEFEGEYCLPGEITVDNEENPNFTVLSLEMTDYPGLLRVVAWVLNGLSLLVENARLRTGEDGVARNTFWLTDMTGKKLDTFTAELVAERVGDFVVYCTPSSKTLTADVFKSGPITVDNKAHEKYTVVTVSGDKNNKQGILLDVASVMTGVGTYIHEAIIQGCKDCGGPELAANADLSSGRIYRFWVTDRQKNKLDFARSSSLLFTLGLVYGQSNGPLRAPNTGLAHPGGLQSY